MIGAMVGRRVTREQCDGGSYSAGERIAHTGHSAACVYIGRFDQRHDAGGYGWRAGCPVRRAARQPGCLQRARTGAAAVAGALAVDRTPAQAGSGRSATLCHWRRAANSGRHGTGKCRVLDGISAESHVSGFSARTRVHHRSRYLRADRYARGTRGRRSRATNSVVKRCAILWLVAILAAPGIAWSCRCEQRSLGDYFAGADVVAVARLKESNDRPNRRLLTFELLAPHYKGSSSLAAGDVETFATAISTASCGIQPDQGAVYIVFAYDRGDEADRLSVDSMPWFRIELYDGEICTSQEPVVSLSGWVPGYGRSGDETVWFYLRGC